MSSDVIRMSLRPRRADKGVFRVGDVVEVSYRNGIELGTLLCKVNSDKWIVKYKNNNLHEQQVSQTSFGRLLRRSSSSSDESAGEKRKRSLRDKRARDRRSAFDSLNANSISSTRKGKKRRKLPANKENEKRVKNSQHAKKDKSREKSDNYSGKSREVEKDKEPVVNTNEEKGDMKLEPKQSAREKRLRMRREAAGEAKNDEPKVKTGRQKNSNGTSSREKEEVVKVKMNTGTLYMYRGSNPRAVFIRRY